MSEPERPLLIKAAAELAAAAVVHAKAWENLFLNKKPEEIGAILGRIFKATLQELQKPTAG